MSILIATAVVTVYLFILKRSKSLAIGLFAISLTYEIKISTNQLTFYLFDLFYIILFLNETLLYIFNRSNSLSNIGKKLRNRLLIYFYWILISLFIGVIFIDDITVSINNMISLMRYMQIISVFILVLLYKLKVHEVKFILKLMYLNAIFVAVYGIVQTLNIQSMSYEMQLWFGRTYSVFTSTGPNALSIYMSFYILSALSFIINKSIKLKYKVLNFIFLLIFSIPFVFSFSRTGYVALFISAIFLLLMNRKKYLPFYFIVSVIVIRSNAIIYDRLISYTFSNGLDVSSIGRLEYWKAAIQTIIHYPISGVGFNGFSTIGLNYTNFFDSLINVHNEYLQLLVNSGIVGFILFISIIILLFKSGMKFRSKNSDPFLFNVASTYLSSIFLLAISSFFSSPFLNFQIIGQFWVVSALIISLREEQIL